MGQKHIDEGADFRFALILVAAVGILTVVFLLA